MFSCFVLPIIVFVFFEIMKFYKYKGSPKKLGFTATITSSKSQFFFDTLYLSESKLKRLKVSKSKHEGWWWRLWWKWWFLISISRLKTTKIFFEELSEQNIWFVLNLKIKIEVHQICYHLTDAHNHDDCMIAAVLVGSVMFGMWQCQCCPCWMHHIWPCDTWHVSHGTVTSFFTKLNPWIWL